MQTVSSSETLVVPTRLQRYPEPGEHDLKSSINNSYSYISSELKEGLGIH